jgi:Uma2 family endonuclease
MAMPAEPHAAFPYHPESWTLEEFLTLPEDQGQRLELIDGSVVVSPAPTFGHQRLLQRIQIALNAVVPQGCELLPGINVVLNGERLLIPDLAVITTPGVEAVYSRADEVLLAVEIHSPSTRAYDRAFKRQLYQEAGIPFLLFVEPSAKPVSAVLYQLDPDGYRPIANSDAGRLITQAPFAFVLDLSAVGG